MLQSISKIHISMLSFCSVQTVMENAKTVEM